MNIDPRLQSPHRIGQPVVIVGERAGGPADEGYVKFTQELAFALARDLPVVFEPGEPKSADAGWPLPRSQRIRQILASDVRPRLSRIGPRALIFCSRSSVTLPALV